ncbi:MAG: ATP-binding protein [Candidatus Marinimicrobia bacterium]|nr:ATP-binding protein [Candidatus Neomarinimicrobiota bacterium]
MVQRHIYKDIKKYLFAGKTLIIFGARQVGKTTLVNEIKKDYKDSSLILNGDDFDVRSLFENINHTRLKPILKNIKLCIVDEAQRIPNSGLALKIIHDNFPKTQCIATGSSAFEIADKIQETMTGRKIDFFLYPFSFSEMVQHHGFLEEKRLLNHRLIYGYYPDIVLQSGREKKYLKSLTSSYLYKDLLSLESIRKPELLEKLLKALALQIGQEVNYNEIAQLIGTNKNTVEKYINLLEKNYIIFRINAFSRNVRNEIKKGRKIYFHDNGIRNAIIDNYQIFENRNDIGALWENFLISERKKNINNYDLNCKEYFWRTTQRQEIDYIEQEDSGELKAFEFKWNSNKRVSAPKTFINGYPNTTFEVISPDNMDTFLLNN